MDITCLRCEGKIAESDEICHIYEKGFCDKYCTFLKKNYKKLLSWRNNDQVSDILSELYERVAKQAKNLTTTTGGQYFRLFDIILRGVIYDHINREKQVKIPRELRKTPGIYSPVSIDDENTRLVFPSETDPDVDIKTKRVDIKTKRDDAEKILLNLIGSNDIKDCEKKVCARLLLDYLLKKRAKKTDNAIAKEYGMALDTYMEKKEDCLKIISAEVKKNWK